MKKITILLLMFLTSFSVLKAVDISIDFETGLYTMSGFDGGALTLEANAEKSGINLSDNVIQMVKGAGQSWAGGTLTLDPNADMTTTKGFTIKVFSPRVGVPVLFKLEGGAAQEKTAYTSVANTWETLTFNLDGASGTYSGITFIMDNGTHGDGSADWTFLMDDIQQVTITGSTDASLSDLSISSGTLAPAFATATYSYTVTDATGTPTVTATKTNANATVVTNNVTSLPGTANIIVVSEAGTSQKYSVDFAVELILPLDFESKPVTADFGNFDGAIATVISNPQSSGINTSATVGQIVRDGGAMWAGSKFTLTSNIDFASNKGISMKVFTAAPVGTKVLFKLDNIGAERVAYTSVSGAWETLTFDFDGTASTGNVVALMFDFGNVGDGSATSTFLFDDIQNIAISGSTDATLSALSLSSGTLAPAFDAATDNYSAIITPGSGIPTVTATATDATNATVFTDDPAVIPGTATVVVKSEAGITQKYSISYTSYLIDLPMDFETKPATADFTDFDGGTATVLANPQSSGINTSTNVGQIVRDGGATHAGSKIELTSGLDFSTNNGISMKVFTTAPIGTKVLFKLDDIGVERDAFTTVTGAWETLTFDFEGTTATGKVVALMFDFGNLGDGTATSTFLFDDIQQVEVASNDATLKELQVNGTSVTGFDANTITYAHNLDLGTTATPEVTATKNQADADVVITQASGPTGTATVLVTAEDGTKKTYTINFCVKVAQALPLTFESGPYDVTNFEGGTLTIIDNPQSSGINTSAKVAQVIKGAGSGAAGAYITLTSNIDFSFRPTISMKVYSPKVGAKLKFKLEGNGVAVERDTVSTVANEWETFTFDFTGTASDAINKLVFLFEYAAIGDGSADFTYLVDDIKQGNSIVASLSDLTINDISIEGFKADSLTYSYELPFGTTDVPELIGVRTDTNAVVKVLATDTLPGTTTLEVTAEDGTTKLSYTVAFTVSTEISTDATLNKILVDSVALEGFKVDSFNYSIVLPFGTTEVPEVAAVANNLAATFVLTKAETLSDTVVIVVTAQDATTTNTYFVSFEVAEEVILEEEEEEEEELETSIIENQLIQSLYPNPTKGKLSITLMDGVFEANLEVYTSNGQLVERRVINTFENSIDLSNNQSGIYYIKLTTATMQVVERIVLD